MFLLPYQFRASAKTLTLVEQKLSSDAAKVEDWCDTNKMAINADKAKCVILTTQRFNRLNVWELNITIGNKRLDQVTTKPPRYQNRSVSIMEGQN